ncbi:hypothetical protein BANRA_03320 [Acinetobacter baumannii]|nr:hypothetical protein BANRA_03320 [Acinetobacter baumannii]
MDELSLLNVVMRITHLSYGSFKLSLLIKTAFYNVLKYFLEFGLIVAIEINALCTQFYDLIRG